MSFCGRCGCEIKNGVRFCPSCGEEVKQKAKIPNDVNVDRRKTLKNNKQTWYIFNWERVFSDGWQGENLKHHLAWIGIHIAIVFIVIFFLLLWIVFKSSHPSAINESKRKMAEDIDKHEKEEKTSDNNGIIDSVSDVIGNASSAINQLNNSLFSSLVGTWTNSSETFSITISKDGTVKIADATGTFGADVFTYTEVDEDTVRLKVDTDDVLVGMLSIDMDYKVNGESMTISALGQTYNLARKKEK